MIHLILGENAYKAEQELARIVKDSGIAPERLDSGSLTANTLADIVRGGSLFSEQRLVVLRQLSDNKPVFEKLVEWAGEVPTDTTLVLLETKLDKRTKAYKALTSVAQVIAANPLTERDHGTAEEWLRKLARDAKVDISPQQVADMVRRGHVDGDKPAARYIDQMQLARAVKALAGMGKVTDDMIATVLPPAVSDTVFDLLEMATRRERAKVGILLANLERYDDPHRTLALLLGQWAQVVSVALADTPPATIAVELSMHPFVVKKQLAIASQFTRPQLVAITELAADIDASVKISKFTPSDGAFRLVHAIIAR